MFVKYMSLTTLISDRFAKLLDRSLWSHSSRSDPRIVLRRGPPKTCQIDQPLGSISNSKTEIDSPVHELSEDSAKFYLKVTDDITGQGKGQIIDYLSLLVLSGKVPASVGNEGSETSSVESGILLSAHLSLWYPRVKSMSSELTRSKNGQNINCSFTWSDACFISSFNKERLNWHYIEHF